MKKAFVLTLLLIMFCTGCKGITINVYSDGNKKTIELDDLEKEVITNSRENEKNRTRNSNTISEKIKEKYDSAKSWYDENKDELKQISDDVFEEDVDALKGIFNSVKTWYDDNNQKIKDANEEIISDDINLINSLFRKK